MPWQRRWHPWVMAKEIDRVRAQSALAVIKQHPGMVLFAASPAIVALGVVWWLFGAGWAALLAGRHGARRRRRRADEAQLEPTTPNCFASGESRPSSVCNGVIM